MSDLNSLAAVFSEVLKRLADLRVDYMVVGSIASVVYGEPRLTKDMDLVVDIDPQVIRSLNKAFPSDQYYCPPLEVLQDENIRRGQFNLIHQQSGLKIDFIFRKNSPHAIAEFERRRHIELWPGLKVFIASPEDIIIKKLDYYREGNSPKHLSDIKGILSGTDIDQNYLNKWIQELGLSKEWQAAKSY